MAFTDWPDGRKHSKSYADHLIAMRNQAGNPLTLPPPPPGTYDPAIDYNAGAAKRGFGQTQNDAQTLFEQGGQNYKLDLTGLETGRDRGLFDLGTSKTRLKEDYGTQTANLDRQYGILGRQQAEGAAQRGVTSAGLLGKSADIRTANQGRDQGQIDLMRDRGLADIGTQKTRLGENFDTQKTLLDLGQARQFGGFNGTIINNPITGLPETGSLETGVQRAFLENNAYQTAALGQKIDQAKAGGYVSPLTRNTQTGGTLAIGSTPMTQQQWQSGLFLDALRKAGYKV